MGTDCPGNQDEKEISQNVNKLSQMYSSKKLKLSTFSSSKIHKIIFTILNFKNSQLYLNYCFSINTQFKFMKYLFYFLLKKKCRLYISPN